MICPQVGDRKLCQEGSSATTSYRYQLLSVTLCALFGKPLVSYPIGWGRQYIIWLFFSQELHENEEFLAERKEVTPWISHWVLILLVNIYRKLKWLAGLGRKDNSCVIILQCFLEFDCLHQMTFHYSWAELNRTFHNVMFPDKM